MSDTTNTPTAYDDAVAANAAFHRGSMHRWLLSRGPAFGPDRKDRRYVEPEARKTSGVSAHDLIAQADEHVESDFGPQDRGCTWPTFDVLHFEAQGEASTILMDEARGNLDICRWDHAAGCFESNDRDAEEDQLSKLETAMTQAALEEDEDAEVGFVRIHGIGHVYDPRAARELLYGRDRVATSIAIDHANERDVWDIDPGDARDAVEALDAEDHKLAGRGKPTGGLAIEAGEAEQLESILGLAEVAIAHDPWHGYAMGYTAARIERLLQAELQELEDEEDWALEHTGPVRKLRCNAKELKARLRDMRHEHVKTYLLPNVATPVDASPWWEAYEQLEQPVTVHPEPLYPRKARVPATWAPSEQLLDAGIAQREALDRRPHQDKGMASVFADYVAAGAVCTKLMLAIERDAAPRVHMVADAEGNEKAKVNRKPAKTVKAAVKLRSAMRVTDDGYVLTREATAKYVRTPGKTMRVKADASHLETLRSFWGIFRSELELDMAREPRLAWYWGIASTVAVERKLRQDAGTLDRMRVYAVRNVAQHDARMKALVGEAVATAGSQMASAF